MAFTCHLKAHVASGNITLRFLMGTLSTRRWSARVQVPPASNGLIRYFPWRALHGRLDRVCCRWYLESTDASTAHLVVCLLRPEDMGV